PAHPPRGRPAAAGRAEPAGAAAPGVPPGRSGGPAARPHPPGPAAPRPAREEGAGRAGGGRAGARGPLAGEQRPGRGGRSPARRAGHSPERSPGLRAAVSPRSPSRGEQDHGTRLGPAGLGASPGARVPPRPVAGRTAQPGREAGTGMPCGSPSLPPPLLRPATSKRAEQRGQRPAPRGAAPGPTRGSSGRLGRH
ncbi:unnamed protein product, partial [Bubo scandiacus]